MQDMGIVSLLNCRKLRKVKWQVSRGIRKVKLSLLTEDYYNEHKEKGREISSRSMR